MKDKTHIYVGAILTVIVAGVWNPFSHDAGLLRGQASPTSTSFQVDPFWPKPLPNDWVTGNVGGTCVDKNDHVFIVSRTADPTNLTAQKKPNIVLVGALFHAQAGNAITKFGGLVEQIDPFESTGCGKKIPDLWDGRHHMQATAPSGAAVFRGILAVRHHPNAIDADFAVCAGCRR